MKLTIDPIVGIALAIAAPFAGGCGTDDGLKPDSGLASGAGNGGAASEPAAEAGGAPSTAGIITSVPEETILSDMSVAEATAVCEDLKSAASELADSEQELLCTLEGLLAGSAVVSTDPAAGGDPTAVCESVKASCMADSSTDADTDCSNAAEATATCDASVEEINACLGALIEFEALAGESLSCDLSNPAVLVLLSTVQAPDACLLVQQKCPQGLS